MRKIQPKLVFTILLSAMISLVSAQTMTETHNNVSCYGGSNGSINITTTGGASPYVYLWNGGVTTEDRTGLAAGLYSVTVTDALGFTSSISVNINQPVAISASIIVTPVNCGGGNTGALNLTVSGGSPGYSYAWNDFVYTEDRTNLSAAVYFVTITDANGCLAYDSANVTQPAGLLLTRTITNVTCGSGSNGAIDLSVQFGTAPYTYSWNDGATTQDRAGIAAGNYSVTVVDLMGCSASTTATVGQSGAGMAINTTNSQPTCNGGSNGTITVTNVIGSVGPYSFAWSDGPTSQNRSGLMAGTYTVTATSSTGCTASTTVNLGQPTAIIITLVPIHVTCFSGNNGAINTTVTGGVSPYSYNWGGGVVTQNRNTLPAGTYTVSVTDTRGCVRTATTTITQPLQLSVSAIPTPVGCTGGPTGGVTSNVNGGNSPYSYNWGGGITTPNRVNVNSGVYNLTVTDMNGCSASTTASVAAYTPLSTSTTQINNTCFGQAGGSINLTVSNGQPGYTYLWSNSATTEDLSGLIAGTYTVTVTDNNGCTVQRTTTITQPGLPISINASVSNVSCNGLTNGSISISVLSGSAPYSYNWGGGIVTQNRTGLSAGSYTVTVTDNLGCTAVSSPIVVGEPAAIALNLTTTPASCFGVADGSMSVNPTGGNAPFTYSWSTGSNSASTSAPGGTYQVTVTDNLLCTAVGTATIAQPTQVQISAVITTVACLGSSTGAINITSSGGNPGYTYNWGGGITTEDRINLSSGIYALTVTDATLCSASSSYTVLDGTSIILSSTVTNVACSGASTGAIDLTVSGGNAPLSYNWGSGITTQDRTGLAAGNYTVTVSDNGGCTASHTASVIQSSTLNLSQIVTNVSCNGGSNGAINVTVSGGASPYSYNWAGGVTTEDRTALSAGTYNLTVTDNSLCNVSASIVITQPTTVQISSSVTNVACAGGNTGSINITTTGGVGPYTYNWGGGITTEDRTGLAANTYTVTASDNNGCSTSHSASILQNPTLTVSSSAITPSCFGGSNGSINTTVLGGTSPYTYIWSGGSATANRTNIPAGVYSLTVTDNFGCSGTHSVTLGQPAMLSANLVSTNVLCNGAGTGAINVTTSGGISPYTYNWGSGITNEDRVGLTAGAYSVTIADNNLCTATFSSTITQPTSISVSITKTDAQCVGSANGSAQAVVAGGNSPYNYLWTTGANTAGIVNLTANNYSVTVTDANSCSASAAIVISEPAAITSSITTTSPSCFGGTNGNLNLSVSGGNGGYQYLWNTSATMQDLNNVGAGTYSVTITDINNCTGLNSATINVPTQTLLNASVTQMTCGGINNGSISLAPSGGSAPYTYNWSNGASTATISNLSSGNYLITVFDNNTCSTTQTITILPSTIPAVTLTRTNLTCNGSNNGTINTTVSGGVAPMQFLWNDGNTSQNRTMLSANTYTVTATGANGCSGTASITITEPSILVLNTTKVDVTCNGSYTGSIDLMPTGGNAPYTYLWSNGWGTQDLSGVSAGTYNVTVTDNTGCTALTTVTLNQPAPFNINLTVTNASCYGSNNGGIAAAVSGGSGGFRYLWSNGDTTQNLSNAPAGNYSLSVTDALNCQASISTNLTQPGAVLLSTSIVNPVCNGQLTGSIDLSTIGGFAPLSYAWSNGATTQDISSVGAGSYIVTVTDATNCSFSLSSVVTSPQSLSLTTTSTNASCNGTSTGAIDLNVSGGTIPYSYNWGNNITTQDRTGIGAGTYFVTVTDASLCSASTSATISEPIALQASIASVATSCFGSMDGSTTVVVSGGTPINGSSYNYVWNSGQTTASISGVGAGNYTVTITDANNCQTIRTVAVTSPNAISINETHNSPSCNGFSDGSINITVTGGNSGYNYIWNTGAVTEDLNSIAAGTYGVTVSDSKSCSASASISLTEPATLTLSETHQDFACSSSQGSINLTVNGGTSPYSFVWNNGAITEDISNLTGGNYDVLVTDANGCNQTTSATIQTLSALALSVTNTNLSCFGASNASVDLTVNGGALPYSFVWNTGAITEDINGLPAGNYDVIVSDANNCVANASASVSQPMDIVIQPSKTDVSCFGGSNGSIGVSVTGGTGSYSYTWSNNSNSASLSSLSAGAFTVTVADANNCTQTSGNIIVTEPTALSASAAVLPLGCNGFNDGAIDLSVSGGIPPYTFNWSNGRITEDISGIGLGSYNVDIKDANNCLLQHTEVVGNAPAVQINYNLVNTPCDQVSKGSIDVTVSGGTPTFGFLWSNGTSDEDLDNLPIGVYTISVTDTRNCSAEANINVSAQYVLSVTTNMDTTITLGSYVQLEALTSEDHNNTYQWSPTQYLSCSNCQTTMARPSFDTQYNVVVTDENGCTASTATHIKVNSVTDLFIPNAFTPNGDGNNDLLQLYGDLAAIKYFEFKVFNRWGEKVFSTTDQNFTWDGTFKGEALDRGAYIYTMDAVFLNGYSKSGYKGSITIIN